MAVDHRCYQEEMSERYPVHCLVWQNAVEELNQLLSENSADVEVVDPRGRTPLHLAVTLGHLECVRALLRHGATATVENSQNWTVLQEAVATGDPEIVQVHTFASLIATDIKSVGCMCTKMYAFKKKLCIVGF